MVNMRLILTPITFLLVLALLTVPALANPQYDKSLNAEYFRSASTTITITASILPPRPLLDVAMDSMCFILTILYGVLIDLSYWVAGLFIVTRNQALNISKILKETTRPHWVFIKRRLPIFFFISGLLGVYPLAISSIRWLLDLSQAGFRSVPIITGFDVYGVKWRLIYSVGAPVEFYLLIIFELAAMAYTTFLLAQGKDVTHKFSRALLGLRNAIFNESANHRYLFPQSI